MKRIATFMMVTLLLLAPVSALAAPLADAPAVTQSYYAGQDAVKLSANASDSAMESSQVSDSLLEDAQAEPSDAEKSKHRLTVISGIFLVIMGGTYIALRKLSKK